MNATASAPNTGASQGASGWMACSTRRSRASTGRAANNVPSASTGQPSASAFSGESVVVAVTHTAINSAAGTAATRPAATVSAPTSQARSSRGSKPARNKATWARPALTSSTTAEYAAAVGATSSASRASNKPAAALGSTKRPQRKDAASPTPMHNASAAQGASPCESPPTKPSHRQHPPTARFRIKNAEVPFKPAPRSNIVRRVLFLFTAVRLWVATACWRDCPPKHFGARPLARRSRRHAAAAPPWHWATP